MTKPTLLFLAHRIPYPPNKGDKIRSYNLLKALAKDYRIYLAAFVDDADDWRHEAKLKQYCSEVMLLGLDHRRKYQALSALATGEALSIPYYRHRVMQQWVDKQIAAQDISRVFVYSSAMAQYVSGEHYRSLHRVVDFVDVDSEKWREYSNRRSWPVSWIYRREANRLFAYDKRIAEEFDASVFVSKQEATLFEQLIGPGSARVTALNNGVDTDYFSPEHRLSSPYRPEEQGQVMVFTGAMDYWANVDAVKWFALEVFPRIRESIPTAKFYIVGTRPTEVVRKLAHKPGVFVTGAVDDVRPYIQHAALSVAPMRIARGIQNKVLEAMAMARPVVATAAAIEGIPRVEGLPVHDDEAPFSEACVRFLQDTDAGNQLGDVSREQVLRDFNWEQNLVILEQLLGDSDLTGASGTAPNSADPVTSASDAASRHNTAPTETPLAISKKGESDCSEAAM